jgi:hypothetical protein
MYALLEEYSLLLVAVSLLGRRMGAVIALSWISHVEGVCSCFTRKCSRWHRSLTEQFDARGVYISIGELS